jgi:hypothetical protein
MVNKTGGTGAEEEVVSNIILYPSKPRTARLTTIAKQIGRGATARMLLRISRMRGGPAAFFDYFQALSEHPHWKPLKNARALTTRTLHSGFRYQRGWPKTPRSLRRVVWLALLDENDRKLREQGK